MNQSLSYEIDAVMPMAVETGLFVSSCTFQAPDGLFGASGAPSGVYVDVAGLVGIACMDAPEAVPTITAGEQKTLQEIQAGQLRHVLLDDYYPTAVTGWPDGWRAVVDGVDYDVLGVEVDSQRTQTRVKLQLVTL